MNTAFRIGHGYNKQHSSLQPILHLWVFMGILSDRFENLPKISQYDGNVNAAIRESWDTWELHRNQIRHIFIHYFLRNLLVSAFKSVYVIKNVIKNDLVIGIEDIILFWSITTWKRVVFKRSVVLKRNGPSDNTMKAFFEKVQWTENIDD